MSHLPGRKNVAVFGHDIPVARKHHRPLAFEQARSVDPHSIHPAKLVGEFLGCDRITVGQVERGNDHPVDQRFDVAAMAIVIIARKADLSQVGGLAAGEDGNPVEALLTVPQRAIVVRDGFNFVFRLAPDKRVNQVKVQTGRLVGERVEVLSGLAADAPIVVNGAGFLNDGDLVRVAEEIKPNQAPAKAVSAPVAIK